MACRILERNLERRPGEDFALEPKLGLDSGVGNADGSCLGDWRGSARYTRIPSGWMVRLDDEFVVRVRVESLGLSVLAPRDYIWHRRSGMVGPCVRGDRLALNLRNLGSGGLESNIQ